MWRASVGFSGRCGCFAVGEIRNQCSKNRQLSKLEPEVEEE